MVRGERTGPLAVAWCHTQNILHSRRDLCLMNADIITLVAVSRLFCSLNKLAFDIWYSMWRTWVVTRGCRPCFIAKVASFHFWNILYACECLMPLSSTLWHAAPILKLFFIACCKLSVIGI